MGDDLRPRKGRCYDPAAVSAGVPTSRRTARRQRATRYAVRRIALLGALVVCVAAVVGAAFAGSSQRLARGTTVGGLDVGGLTVADASRRLERASARVDQTPVRFTALGKSWSLAANQLGVRVDWDGAVALAAQEGDGFGPVRGLRRLQVRFFGAEVAPRASSFASVLDYETGLIARAIDRKPVEASVQRRGLKFAFVPGKRGATLNRAAAAETIVRALASLDRGPPVALPLVTRDPRLVETDLTDALGKARLAVSAPVTLRAGETQLRLPRWRIATLLNLPTGGETRLAVGGKAADAWLSDLQKRVNHAPREATFAVRPGGIDVVPDRPGRALDVAAGVGAIEHALFSTGSRVASLPLETARAERTTAKANEMGITGIVGSYTTTYGGTPGRLANVQLVAELIDGTLVEPGATFSFNDTTGERNAAKGFQDAPVIINGELKSGIGGGVCQVSTTVFNAAFEAGLPIGSRTNHALYISHYPLGRDATVNYPDIDLSFSNDTDAWLLVRTFVNAGSLTVNLYGTPQHRRVETDTAPLTANGKPPIKRTRDPKLRKGRRVVDVVGIPPRETSVVRRVYDADGEFLYENTWRSYYVGEPTLVRVGTKPKPPVEAGGAPGPSGTDTTSGTTATSPTTAIGPTGADDPVSGSPAVPTRP